MILLFLHPISNLLPHWNHFSINANSTTKNQKDKANERKFSLRKRMSLRMSLSQNRRSIKRKVKDEEEEIE